MPDDIPNADHIEKEIEEERSKLYKTLDTLADRVSVDRWLNDAAGSLQQTGGELGASVRRTAQENPAALALTGAGIALAAFGVARMVSSNDDWDDASSAQFPRLRFDDDGNAQYRGYDARSDDRDDDRYSSHSYSARRQKPRAVYDPASRPTSPGLRDADPLDPSFDARVARADRTMAGAQPRLAEERQDSFSRDPWNIATGEGPGDVDTDGTEAGAMTTRSRNYDDRDYKYDYGDGYSESSPRASDLKARFRDGLENFSNEAQERVLSARARAIDVQDAVEHQARNAARGTASAFQKNPLLFGFGALAVGATIAALIPRNSEDRRRLQMLRERVMTEARGIYEEEKHRAVAAASAAIEEGKSVAKAAASEAIDPNSTTKTDVSEAKSKVVGAAKSAYDEKRKNKTPSGGDPNADGTISSPTPDRVKTSDNRDI